MRHEGITIGSFCELKKAVEKKQKSAGAKTPPPEKAAPVVKEAVKKLLDGKLRKWTIAYASARRGDGGLGATYALLKKHA